MILPPNLLQYRPFSFNTTSDKPDFSEIAQLHPVPGQTVNVLSAGRTNSRYMQVVHTYTDSTASLCKLNKTLCTYSFKGSYCCGRCARDCIVSACSLLLSQPVLPHLHGSACAKCVAKQLYCSKWRSCIFFLASHPHFALWVKPILFFRLGKKMNFFIVFSLFTVFQWQTLKTFSQHRRQLKMQSSKGSYAGEQKPAGVEWKQKRCCKVSYAP